MAVNIEQMESVVASERAVDCLLAGCSSGNGRSARAKHAGPRMKLKLKY